MSEQDRYDTQAGPDEMAKTGAAMRTMASQQVGQQLGVGREEGVAPQPLDQVTMRLDQAISRAGVMFSKLVDGLDPILRPSIPRGDEPAGPMALGRDMPGGSPAVRRVDALADEVDALVTLIVDVTARVEC